MSRRFLPCTLALTDGSPVVEGTVLTGAQIEQWVASNGLIRVSKVDLVPNPDEGGLTMKRWDSTTSTWLDCFGPTYGDWCFFTSPLTGPPSSVTAITVNPDEIVLAIRWAPHPLNIGYLPAGGVYDRDWTGAANYDNGGTLKKITSLEHFTKTIRILRGREGYFVGYHSFPNISPKNGLAGNNEAGYGEREAGTGGSNAVFWTSAGFTARHPEWGSNANWGGGSDYSTSRHAWGRIDDQNTSAPYTDAAYIAYQNAIHPSTTFPAEQTAGPWYVADLSAANWTSIKVCRYITFFNRLEVASWQFAAADYGATVVHFVNELADPATGDFVPYQLFIGAFPYTSPYDLTTQAGRANEPTVTLRAKVRDRAPLVFAESGIAQDEDPAERTTSAQVRDLMLATLRALVPSIAAERPFRDYRNDAGEFVQFCERNPVSAHRLVSIRDVGDLSPPAVSDSESEWVETEFDVLVAYPYGNSWGDLAALSLDDVMELDAKAIDRAIGTTGYMTLDTSSGGDACVRTLASTRVAGDACTFLALRLSVQFWRTL